ncbi:hypothetical protein [Paenibacillus sp. FSL R5-0914]|uniref:hypothetical protein n=1 Tax=Paenibacillus sp. FSL R5-0914 TaxID=2921665 RepID=UPI0030FB64FF
MGIMCQEDATFAKTMTKDVLVRVVFSSEIALSIERDNMGVVKRLVIMMGNTSQVLDLLDHDKSENEILQFIETQYIELKRSFESSVFEKKFNIMLGLSWKIKFYIEN